MEEEITPGPKIDIAIGVLGTIGFGVFDFLSLIPGVSDILEVPSGVVFFAGLAGGLGSAFVTSELIADTLKAIPGAQALPTWTLAWWFSWYAANHPSRLTKTVEFAAKATTGAGALDTAQSAKAITDTPSNSSLAPQTTDAPQNAIAFQGASPENSSEPTEQTSASPVINDEFATKDERAPMENAYTEDFQSIPTPVPSADSSENPPRKMYDISRG